MLRKSLREEADAAPLDFIVQHSVFRLQELEAAFLAMGRPAENAVRSAEYHIAQKRLFSVRRGVYVHTTWVDPWLLASKLTEPVVISHDGALSFHGLTGVGHRVSFMTSARTSTARYNDIVYQPLRVSERRLEHAGSKKFEREGQPLFVTSLEHTLVDCLALLSRAPPPVELMELFRGSVATADPGRMISHAISLESPLLVSRLAHFLSWARFDLEPRHLQKLNASCAKTPTYFHRGGRTSGDRFVQRWNLVVPPDLFY